MSRLSLVCLFVEDKWVTREYIPSVIWCRNIRLHEAMKGPSYFVPRHFRLQEEGLSQRHNEGGGLSLASVSGQSPVMAIPELRLDWASGLSLSATGRSRDKGIGSSADHGEWGMGSSWNRFWDGFCSIDASCVIFQWKRTSGHQAQQLKLNLEETGLT